MARTRAGGVDRETATVVGLVAGSQYVNHAYLVLLPPILPVLSREFGVTVGLLGLVLGASAAANTAFQLPFGYLADHHDRTLTLGLSSLLGGVGALLTAVAPDVTALLVGQVVLGVGVAGHHPAHYPLLADAVSEDTRGRAFAVYNVGGNLGFATPPAVITAVVGLGAGYTWRHAVGLVGAAGLLYGLAVTAAFAVRVSDDVTAPNVAAGGSDGSLRERAQDALRGLLAEPGVLALALLALLATTAGWGVTSYAVVFLTDVYELPLGTANLALTGLFVVGAGAVLVGGVVTDRFGGGRVLLASYLGVTLAVALLAAQLVPAMGAVGLLLLVGAIRAAGGPARDELTERLAATGTVGTSFAIVTVGLMLGSTVAPPLFGFVIEVVDVTAAFYLIAATAALTTLMTLLVLARYVDRPAAGASPAD
jgi:MFS family permease